jgi:hypothetical protein
MHSVTLAAVYELLKWSQYGDEEGIEEGKEINNLKSTQ